MKIKFLGTAAAEGWPALFCECEACEKARVLGGRNIRTRSSTLIDDIYMIDFSADTYMHKLVHNLDMSKVEHIFITHSHNDHFYPEDFEMRINGFAHIKDKKILNVYGNKAVKKKYDDAIGFADLEGTVQYNVVEPFRYFKAGDAMVMPLLADHNKKEDCYIYIIEIGGKVLLYGHDSGYFSEETWSEIAKHRFDGVILDCTFGHMYRKVGHMGIATDAEVKDRMLKEGSADSNTSFIINHFSHNIKMTHDEIEKMAEVYDFIVAYDGFQVEI